MLIWTKFIKKGKTFRVLTESWLATQNQALTTITAPLLTKGVYVIHFEAMVDGAV